MTRKSSPTMKDVAKEAGVALGTVSKVINGIPVTEEYKKRVDEAIARLNYEVNTYARGLKTQKTGIIALLIPDTLNPFFAAFATHIENALYEKGLKTLLCCSEGNPQKEITYLNLSKQNKVDAIIALTYSDIGGYISPDMPIVVFDRFFENRNIPRVGSDNYGSAIAAVEKLLELGVKHPVYIRFHSIFPGESDRRRDGYFAACKKHGIEPDYLDETDSPEKVEQMRAFIDRHRLPDGSLSFDGVFCHTDYHADLLCNMLRSEGFRIPEDIQVIGFDGIYRFGNEADGLFVSSMCQNIPLLARKCVEIITAKDRADVPSLTLLPAVYRWGGTTLREKE